MKPAPPVTTGTHVLIVGVFVAIEGVDGCGKSTQARLLEEHLRTLGREVRLDARARRHRARRARPEARPQRAARWRPGRRPRCFAASRAEHAAEVIRPALARGADVVSDRFVDSSLAYQGIARGLGLDAVLELNLTVLEGLLPDRDVRARAGRGRGRPAPEG